jgi:uncharacterized protein (DUF58 family)
LTEAVRLLAMLRDLELVARRVVDGIRFGVHPSRSAGHGVEFSQFRSYQPGDDPRLVDWKLYARSERFFVREAEHETSVPVRLAVDASESMGYEEGGVSLLAAARVVAGVLALLAGRQGDTVGLYPLSDDPNVIPAVPATRDRRQVSQVLAALERLRPAGALPDRKALETLLLEGPRGLTVLISDLHERADELRATAVRLANLGHDVSVIHLVGAREREFAYDGAVTFEELETGRTVRVDAAVARLGYLAAQTAAWHALERELGEHDVSYVRLGLDEPLDEVLRRHLRLRARRG